MLVTRVGPDLAMRQVVKDCPDILNLVGDVDSTGEVADPDPQAPPPLSVQLFGHRAVEFDRTAASTIAEEDLRSGDYDHFVAGQRRLAATGQLPATQVLSREHFGEFRTLYQSVCPDAESQVVMRNFMIFHDFGKSHAWRSSLEARAAADLQPGEKNPFDGVDHDEALLLGLQRYPALTSSFSTLPPAAQQRTLNGLECGFELPQFMQAESLPGSLQGFAGLSSGDADFWLLHAALDIAGANGHLSQDGSRTVTESTWMNLQRARTSLQGLQEGRSAATVYRTYLAQEAQAFGLPLDTPEDIALVRLSCMVRASGPASAGDVRQALAGLDEATRQTLITELNCWGTDKGKPGLLLEYAPALLINAHRYGGAAGLTEGLGMLSRLYAAGRQVAGSDGDVFPIDINDVAKHARTPAELASLQIQIVQGPQGYEARAVPQPS